MRRALALGIVVPALGQAQAADPRAAQPERPTVATHAGTVATGYLEIETGIEHDRAGGATTYGAPTIFKLGVGRRTQLSLGTPFVGGDGVNAGFGDLSLGLKWRIVEDHRWLKDFAIQPIIKWPTGGDRSTNTTDASVLLIDSRTVGPVAIDLNAGITRRSGDGTDAPKTSTLWTASFGAPLAGALGGVLEVYGYPGTSGAAGQAPIVALLTGPTYTVTKSLVLDVGVIVPIAGPQPHAIYAGLTTNVGRIFPR